MNYLRGYVLLYLLCLLYPQDVFATPVKGEEVSFVATDLRGRVIELKDYRGKVVLVDFWASWCEPCKVAMPFYQALQKRFPEKLVVLGVSMDEDRAALQAALKKRPVDFKILHDPSGKIAEYFSVEAMPSSFILDARGRLQFEHRGFVEADKARIIKWIQGLVVQ
jgi:thiol-disulfide isomerase/thioredoxin